MDLKRYRKTRYENIYQNIKNKNYIITISNPKTTISEIDGKKIYEIDIAKKIRDNDKIKQLRASKIAHIDTFNQLWDKYMFDCKYVKKLAYKTLKKKKEFYKNYFIKYFDNKKVTKITKKDILLFIDDVVSSDKQKNEILSSIKAFFNWCASEEYILTNPANYINKIRVEKSSIEYWLPEHIKQFINTLNYYIENGTNNEIIDARTIKMLTIIGLALGNRIGETRALKFSNINEEYKHIEIKNSINYDPDDPNPVKETKTIASETILPITDKFIKEINEYKLFMQDQLGLTINNNTFIFYNPMTNKPYSDTLLRKKFYYFIDKANVPKIKMYNLRHTYATNLLYKRKNIAEVSRMLRHTNISITASKYADIIDNDKREVASTTDEYY